MTHCCRDVRVKDAHGNEVVGMYQSMKKGELQTVQQALSLLNGWGTEAKNAVPNSLSAGLFYTITPSGRRQRKLPMIHHLVGPFV
ncbi:hypothetical protein GBAR_LOCUS31612 [Geodia barretti]|nr:hypothetical protein GBAR_LOCUS31612 [Geodia barretti]